MTAKTLFEKVWERHEVVPESPDTPAVLYIDLHLTHEVTSPQAFSVLRDRGLPVRRPDRTLVTMDHSTPTQTSQVFGGVPITLESAARQVRQLELNCAEFGLDLIGLRDERRGIVHVIGPELGATQPGKTIVCGDSHTSTHGAFGALAFGIGTTEVGYVLATQCLLQRKPKTLAIEVAGRLGPGVTAKDLVLAIIGRIGVNGGTGHVVEFRGPAVEAHVDGRAHDGLQHVHRGRRARRDDRPGRNHVHVPERPSARPAGRCLGTSGRRLAHARIGSRRGVRQDGAHRRGCGRAHDHLWDQSRDGGAGLGRSTGPTRRCRLHPRALLHGARAGPIAARPVGAGSVHRQLHQRQTLGPGACGSRVRGTQACAGREGAGRSWITADQAPGRGTGTCEDLH